MHEISTSDTYRRTLPLFDNQDRDTIQRLLHHAVEDFRYDHPDRKIARDIYHEIHEGDAIRLFVGSELENKTLVISPTEIDIYSSKILERLISEMQSSSGEWSVIGTELNKWQDDKDSIKDIQIAFQYLH